MEYINQQPRPCMGCPYFSIRLFVGLLVLALTLWWVEGCSIAPVHGVSNVPLDSSDPAVVREDFTRALPIKYQLINTVVFRYHNQVLSVLGYSTVDAGRQAFTIAGLSPVGVKLFELTGDQETVQCTFAVQEFTRWGGDFAEAVSGAVRAMYFNCIPDQEAKALKERYRIIFKEPADDGIVEYVFAGAQTALVEKRFRREGDLVWSVLYSQYQRKDGKLYPGKIVFKHHQYRYQLVVRLKEIVAVF